MSQNILAEIGNFEEKFKKIKNSSGTHSPSMKTLQDTFPQIDLKVDACFLSNPYATDLIMQHMQCDLLNTNKLREVLEHYPSQQSNLTFSLSKLLHVNKENIFIGNGAIEIIQALLHRVVGQKMALIIPTFSSYYEFAKKETEVVCFSLKEEENYELNINDYVAFVKKEKPDTVVIINPNNPNGSYLSLSKMKNLLLQIQEVKNVILDESFIHFASENDALDLVDTTSLFREFSNVIIVKSLSKDFGIAGARIGYALMNEKIVNAFLNDGYLWNINGIAEYLIRLISNEAFFEDYKVARKTYLRETKNFFNALHTMKGLHVYPSMANFVLIKLPPSISSSFFVAALLYEHGIYVRTATDKIGLDGQCIRISARRKEENKLILNALASVLHQFEGNKA